MGARAPSPSSPPPPPDFRAHRPRPLGRGSPVTVARSPGRRGPDAPSRQWGGQGDRMPTRAESDKPGLGAPAAAAPTNPRKIDHRARSLQRALSNIAARGRARAAPGLPGRPSWTALWGAARPGRQLLPGCVWTQMSAPQDGQGQREAHETGRKRAASSHTAARVRVFVMPVGTTHTHTRTRAPMYTPACLPRCCLGPWASLGALPSPRKLSCHGQHSGPCPAAPLRKLVPCALPRASSAAAEGTGHISSPGSRGTRCLPAVSTL